MKTSRFGSFLALVIFTHITICGDVRIPQKAEVTQVEIKAALKEAQLEFQKDQDRIFAEFIQREQKAWEEQAAMLSVDVLFPRMELYIAEKVNYEGLRYFIDLINEGKYSRTSLLASMLIAEDNQAPISILPFIAYAAINRMERTLERSEDGEWVQPQELRQVILGKNAQSGRFGRQQAHVPFATNVYVLHASACALDNLDSLHTVSKYIQAFKKVLRKNRSLQTLVIADMLVNKRLQEYNFKQNVFLHVSSQRTFSRKKSVTGMYHDAPGTRISKWKTSLGAVELDIPLPKEIREYKEDYIVFFCITNPIDPYAYNKEDIEQFAKT